MTRWRPYPEYNHSDLPWLPEVPAHWDIRKLKQVSSVTLSNVDKQKIEGEKLVHLCNYVDVYYNDYITADLEFMEATASPEEVRKFALKERDVIITKDSESWDDIAVAAYVPSDLEGVLCGYHLALVRPNQRVIDGKYLFQSFCASQINEQFTVEATGITRYGLAKHWIDNASFLVPPLPEQHAIAAFLDHQTAKIDALITEQRHLIELLQERRAALISHAVTKGLEPTAPMRDAGVPWLAQIPKHWEAKQIRYIAESLQTGPFGSQLHSSDYVTDGIPIVNPSHMKDGFIEPDQTVAADDETCKRLARHKLRAGDIVFARRGELGRRALVTPAQEGWLCGTGSLRMRPRPELAYSPFLNRALSTKGVSEWLLLQSVGSTMDNLNTSILSRLPLPIPPLNEQQAIAAHLDRETATIDALIAEIEAGIAHLEEYRTTLISAAVTGKIDVRGALPADAPAQPRLTSP